MSHLRGNILKKKTLLFIPITVMDKQSEKQKYAVINQIW